MHRQEKFGIVHFVLIALTAAFLATLAGLAARESGAAAKGAYGAAAENASRAGTEGTYRVETERVLPTEAEGEAAHEPIDVNTATAEELQELTGIGPVLAQAIVDYRAEHGPFRSVDELLEVSGIGEAKLGGIRNEITVNGG